MHVTCSSSHAMTCMVGQSHATLLIHLLLLVSRELAGLAWHIYRSRHYCVIIIAMWLLWNIYTALHYYCMNDCKNHMINSPQLLQCTSDRQTAACRHAAWTHVHLVSHWLMLWWMQSVILQLSKHFSHSNMFSKWFPAERPFHEMASWMFRWLTACLWSWHHHMKQYCGALVGSCMSGGLEGKVLWY